MGLVSAEVFASLLWDPGGILKLIYPAKDRGSGGKQKIDQAGIATHRFDPAAASSRLSPQKRLFISFHPDPPPPSLFSCAAVADVPSKGGAIMLSGEDDGPVGKLVLVGSTFEDCEASMSGGVIRLSKNTVLHISGNQSR